MATPDRRAGLAGQHDLAAPWLLAFALLWIALLLSGVARAATGEPGAAAGTGAAVTERSAVALGQRLYEDGIGVDGTPIQAHTARGSSEEGGAVACMRCHRRCGLGSVEGMIRVPPITGLALHAGTKLRERVILPMDGFRGRAWNPSHAPYDDATLARAILSGLNVSGATMLAMMPRYSLSDADLAALSAYLDQLSASWSPGVTDKAVELATVIAPGIDPRRRQAFLDTLRAAFDIKNSNTMPGHRHMINAAEMILNVERNWNLQVWELSGPEAGWPAQLDALYRTHPVFAVVSGLSDGGWDPMQALCNRERMPCWFPSVRVPPEQQGPRDYGLYFNEGVRLEAAVVAAALALRPTPTAQVVQLQSASTAAGAAAAALDVDLRASASAGAKSEVSHHLDKPAQWPAAIARLKAGDALVLWLGPEDLQTLTTVAPPRGVHVYLSAMLAGAEHAPVPPAWRDAVTLIYPYELPSRRHQNMATFQSWIAMHHLDLVDEAMQSEVFFAVNYLQFTMSEMLDNVYRDLLLERGQDMLTRRELQRAEEETTMRMQGHPPAREVAAAARLAPGAIYGNDPQGPLAQNRTQALLERRGTTIYPRLGLAIGQHYASKGAYLARLSALTPLPGAAPDDAVWMVPERYAAEPVAAPRAQGAPDHAAMTH